MLASSPELSSARFGYNQISEIDPDASVGATSLTEIDFMHNLLTTISPNRLTCSIEVFVDISHNLLEPFHPMYLRTM